jgi:hypothetical protein
MPGPNYPCSELCGLPVPSWTGFLPYLDRGECVLNNISMFFPIRIFCVLVLIPMSVSQAAEDPVDINQLDIELRQAVADGRSCLKDSDCVAVGGQCEYKCGEFAIAQSAKAKILGLLRKNDNWVRSIGSKCPVPKCSLPKVTCLRQRCAFDTEVELSTGEVGQHVEDITIYHKSPELTQENIKAALKGESMPAGVAIEFVGSPDGQFFPVLRGEPTKSGDYSFTIWLAHAVRYRIHIDKEGETTLADGHVGFPYSAALFGGRRITRAEHEKLLASKVLPPGLTLHVEECIFQGVDGKACPAQPTLKGKPVKAGNYSFRIDPDILYRLRIVTGEPRFESQGVGQ